MSFAVPVGSDNGGRNAAARFTDLLERVGFWLTAIGSAAACRTCRAIASMPYRGTEHALPEIEFRYPTRPSRCSTEPGRLWRGPLPGRSVLVRGGYDDVSGYIHPVVTECR